MTILYHDGNRRLQDQFDSRRIADRLEQKLARTAFTNDDKAFIESRIPFFLATADADGRPTCNHKGGGAGFVRVVGPDELAFPDYDGNGMFLAMGNIAVNAHVGPMSASCSSTSRNRSGCASRGPRAPRATIRCSRTPSARSSSCG